MGAYAYRGATAFIEAVGDRLSDIGWDRTDDIADADAVITFFPSMNDLEDLCFGDDGLMQLMCPSAVLVDLSAVTPNFAREMNAIATLSDLRFVEAPLACKNMVAPDAFDRANLVCFAAGEEGSADTVRDILDALFCDVRMMGGGGAAQLARAANTIQNIAEVISAIEAQALFAASRRSISSMEMGDTRVEPVNYVAQSMLQAIDAKRFDGAFTCEMLMGELSAALMAADDYELIIPQAESALHLLELLTVIGGADKSPAALSLVYGDEASCAENGLDWQRAEQLYAQEEFVDQDAYGDDADYLDYLDDDEDPGEMGFGYSVN